MKNKVGILAFLLCASVVLSNPYDSWSNFRMVSVNTTTAGVSGTVTNYPLLVRLTNADSAHGSNVLAGALSGGADVRFSDWDGDTTLSYQIEQWSATSAAIWVLVPSVAGSATTNIRLYWGKTGAADSSNGSRVFSPSNGFLTVWHFNEASGSPLVDVTGNGNTATPAAGGAAPTDLSSSIIGAGKTFASASAQFYLVGSTASTLNLDVNNGPYTITAWVNPTTCPTARMVVIAKYDNGNAAGTRQYALQTANTATTWRMTNDPNTVDFTGATTNNEYTADVTTSCTTGAWSYLAASYSLTGTPTLDATGAANLKLSVNGATASTGVTANQGTGSSIGTNSLVYIGKMAGTTQRYLNGSLDELSVSNVARDSNWIKLNYQTQNVSQTAVTLGSTQITGSAPGAPTGVAGVAGDAQVIVAWTAPSSSGTATISAYTVMAVQDTSKHCTTTGALTCTVTGLTNGTGYSFTVTATNSVGTGAASLPSIPVIPQPVVGTPTAPLSVSGTAGNRRVTVTWSAPSSNGGSTITGYTVTSNPDGKTCTTTGALTCVDSTLTNGTSYTFTVTAANSVGTGPASAPSASVTPVGPPTAPASITVTPGNARVVVSWTAPASNGGLTITGYTATANPGGAICTTTGALTCVDSTLTNGSTYLVTVTATNSAGTGPGVTSGAVVPFTVPGAPTSVTAVAGAGQAVVSWTAPTSNGGSAITGYTVKGVSDSTKTCTPSPATATTCTVTGLTAGTWSFTVRALNAAGAGNAGTSNTITGILGFSAMNGFGIHMTGSSVVFRLPSGLASGVRVSVMDVWGRTVWSQTASTGVSELSWNGKSAGKTAARGIYFVRLTTAAGGKSRVLAESKIPMLP